MQGWPKTFDVLSIVSSPVVLDVMNVCCHATGCHGLGREAARVQIVCMPTLLDSSRLVKVGIPTRRDGEVVSSSNEMLQTQCTPCCPANPAMPTSERSHARSRTGPSKAAPQRRLTISTPRCNILDHALGAWRVHSPRAFYNLAETVTCGCSWASQKQRLQIILQLGVVLQLNAFRPSLWRVCRSTPGGGRAILGCCFRA